MIEVPFRRTAWVQRFADARRALPVRRYGLQLGTLVMALIIWTFFAVKAPGTWLHFTIYSSLMSTVPFVAIVGLALTLVVIAREIDLSFPSVMAVGTLVFVNVPGDPFLALVAAIATGIAVGLLNGLIVVKMGIPSLIATIGTMFFWRGMVLWRTGGKGTGLVDQNASWVGKMLVGRVGGGSLSIPVQMFWTIGIALALWLFLNRHRFGAHVYLVGDNTESAKMMGVKADRIRIATFALIGAAAAFAGVISSLEVSFFWPTVGDGQLLPTIAAVFLGGTSVFGGVGTIFGTTLGSFITGSIEPGIVSVGWTGLLTQVITGAIIVLALAMQAVVIRGIRR